MCTHCLFRPDAGINQYIDRGDRREKSGGGDLPRFSEQLSESEKFAALGRIAANVADEIRNPLTAVGGFARRLDKKLPEGSKEKEYSQFITAEVTRLEGILRNVLSLSRGASLRLEECNLSEIVEEAVKLFEEGYKEQSIKVGKSIEETPPILAWIPMLVF